MEIKITTEYIKLQQALKFAGLVNMGSDAKAYILDGMVKVNGEVCLQRGKKLREGDIFEFDGKSCKVTI
ncbi:MAG: RNA-binding S4 domain-containing protein [Ruminococcus sp.]|jgi:ribosome-associated protein|nr:RNA-binding S4 domain-containing protein [Ruminococcus sp.]